MSKGEDPNFELWPIVLQLLSDTPLVSGSSLACLFVYLKSDLL